MTPASMTELIQSRQQNKSGLVLSIKETRFVQISQTMKCCRKGLSSASGLTGLSASTVMIRKQLKRFVIVAFMGQ